jgi:bacterioferritin
MKGDPKVIDYLNKGLRSELTAVSQYWLHYRLLDNWGLKDLAKQWRKESIEEMRHADRFVDRIIFLDGFPNMQVLDPLHIGQSVKEVLDADLAAEIGARALYQEAATYCHSVKDYPSRDLFEDLMKDGVKLDDALTDQIKKRIRAGASPRHVPAKVVAVADIPRTRSGKITEIAVREIVHGRAVKNTEALANPEALELYKNIPALMS